MIGSKYLKGFDDWTKRMEKYSNPIFRFSCLVCILPYYGHLHEWRILLNRLWTHTKQIWDKCPEVFERAGKNFKKEIILFDIKILDQVDDSPYNKIYFDYEFVEDQITDILNLILKSNFEVSWDKEIIIS